MNKSFFIGFLLIVLFFYSCQLSTTNNNIKNTDTIPDIDKDDDVKKEKEFLNLEDSLVNIKTKKKEEKVKAISKPKDNQRKSSAQTVKSDLPDFASIQNVTQKKVQFFNYLRPLVINENNKILENREYVKSLLQKQTLQDSLTTDDLKRLNNWAKEYRIEQNDYIEEQAFKDLLFKMDIIPVELVLTQAALESAWGTSYFTRSINNIFGQWCFTPNCGFVPRKRPAGQTHEVMVFQTVSLAINSYMLFLNSHPLFSSLRQSRYNDRQHGEEPSGYRMANGLRDYSARGKHYVNDVRSMIKGNKKYMGLDE